MKKIKDRIRAIAGANRLFVPGMAVAGVLAAMMLLRWGYGYHVEAVSKVELGREVYRASSMVLARAQAESGRIAEAEREVEALERGLVSSARPSIGGAELQEAFKRISSRKRVGIISEKVLATVESGPYVRIPIEFRLNADTSQLKDLLYDLRSSSLVMGIRQMTVRAADGGGGALDVTLVVEGAARKEVSR